MAKHITEISGSSLWTAFSTSNSQNVNGYGSSYPLPPLAPPPSPPAMLTVQSLCVDHSNLLYKEKKKEKPT